jgi:hypothetical protein
MTLLESVFRFGDVHPTGIEPFCLDAQGSQLRVPDARIPCQSKYSGMDRVQLKSGLAYFGSGMRFTWTLRNQISAPSA